MRNTSLAAQYQTAPSIKSASIKALAFLIQRILSKIFKRFIILPSDAFPS